MDISAEAALLGQLVTSLTGFADGSENHTLSKEYMVRNAVEYHNFPSTFSVNVQRELSACVSLALRMLCDCPH